ncbi:AbrB family transcriptional regulator [Bacillus pinisoli]|uniref:AbrB family transcriptional regulator n=1 Tax=Bacillus pinisoli TaxID=2901866 RepID=UPI001FF15994
MKKILSLLETLFIAFIGGLLFTFLHLPLAWMLGSLFIVVIWKLVVKREIVSNPLMRNSGLIIIGYMLGISFTYDTLIQMTKMLPAMFATTILLIGFSLLVSVFAAKFLGISFKTALIGMMPGGFSQMVLLGEEIEDVDVTSVTLIQLIRLLSVIYLVPAIVRIEWFGENSTSHTIASEAMTVSTTTEAVLFLVVTALSAVLAVKAKLPTPYLVGPILGCGILVISGFDPFSIPEPLLVTAQIFLGIHVGKMVDPKKLENWKLFGTGAVISCLILLLSTILIAGALKWVYPISLGTAFLSTAPGGIAEMGLTAQAIGADLSIVTGFQLFRIFFILFVVPPVVVWVFKKHRAFGK